jgi:hypothetical protein
VKKYIKGWVGNEAADGLWKGHDRRLSERVDEVVMMVSGDVINRRLKWEK